MKRPDNPTAALGREALRNPHARQAAHRRLHPGRPGPGLPARGTGSPDRGPSGQRDGRGHQYRRPPAVALVHRGRRLGDGQQQDPQGLERARGDPAGPCRDRADRGPDLGDPRRHRALPGRRRLDAGGATDAMLVMWTGRGLERWLGRSRKTSEEQPSPSGKPSREQPLGKGRKPSRQAATGRLNQNEYACWCKMENIRSQTHVDPGWAFLIASMEATAFMAANRVWPFGSLLLLGFARLGASGASTPENDHFCRETSPRGEWWKYANFGQVLPRNFAPGRVVEVRQLWTTLVLPRNLAPGRVVEVRQLWTGFAEKPRPGASGGSTPTLDRFCRETSPRGEWWKYANFGQVLPRNLAPGRVVEVRPRAGCTCGRGSTSRSRCAPTSTSGRHAATSRTSRRSRSTSRSPSQRRSTVPTHRFTGSSGRFPAPAATSSPRDTSGV